MAESEIAVEPLLTSLAEQLDAELERRGVEAPALVGIHTGGVWVARELQQRLHDHPPVGTLEVAFHRDDHATSGIKAAVQPSEVPVEVDGRTVVLVDDVIHTARTIRAALNALFDYGRPAAVLLAVLLDRNGRELPIQPDLAARRIELPEHQRIKLRGPDPLRFVVEEKD